MGPMRARYAAQAWPGGPGPLQATRPTRIPLVSTRAARLGHGKGVSSGGSGVDGDGEPFSFPGQLAMQCAIRNARRCAMRTAVAMGSGRWDQGWGRHPYRLRSYRRPNIRYHWFPPAPCANRCPARHSPNARSRAPLLRGDCLRWCRTRPRERETGDFREVSMPSKPASESTSARIGCCVPRVSLGRSGTSPAPQCHSVCLSRQIDGTLLAERQCVHLPRDVRGAPMRPSDV
jgi:hypothetical protein